jgi:hypothetical protein
LLQVAQGLRQHPLVWFYLLAFGWTWTVNLLLPGLWRQPAGGGGEAGGVEDALRSILPAVLGGPILPALLMTAIINGRAGVGRLLRRCVQWRVASEPRSHIGPLCPLSDLLTSQYTSTVLLPC